MKQLSTLAGFAILTFCFYSTLLLDLEPTLRKELYFYGHAIGILLIAFSVTGKKWVRDACIAVALGRCYDELTMSYLGMETNLNGLYSLLLIPISLFWRSGLRRNLKNWLQKLLFVYLF